MKPRPPLPGGPYLVVGLARSGVAAAYALLGRGEEVIGLDTGTPEIGRLRDVGVEVHVDVDGIELVQRARTLVKSPGVPHDAPVVAAARGRGMPVIGELELAWRLIPNDFVAVTGTNGKTTTTELLGEMHRQAGLPVAVAGNVGTALSGLVDRLEPGATVVCEASSFQLEDTEAFAPEAAALINLGEDHLDRHGTFEAYRDAKLRAFARQEPADAAVAPLELAPILTGAGRRITFGEGREPDVGLHAGHLWWEGRELIRTSDIRLRGRHNLDNAMAAVGVALARGLPGNAVRGALRSFAGVPHRMEEVADIDGVLYVNDSKATNVGSTVVALASFESGVHLILGGRGKGGGYAALRAPVAAHCRAVYLIGEAADEIAGDLDGLDVAIMHCGDLDHAVPAARAAARRDDVVLLSPACASFDQYSDYEARGVHFSRLVTGRA
jgi:UDP-N-acetylmuramoylalanine--D-glutamate ligase